MKLNNGRGHVCNNFKEIERKLFVKIIALIFKEKWSTDSEKNIFIYFFVKYDDGIEKLKFFESFDLWSFDLLINERKREKEREGGREREREREKEINVCNNFKIKRIFFVKLLFNVKKYLKSIYITINI